MKIEDAALPASDRIGPQAGDEARFAAAQIPRALRTVRANLGMDVAFVSEFRGGRRIFRYVDSSFPSPSVRVGASDPLERSLCRSVVDGRVPELVRDTAALPAARAFSETAGLPTGAWIAAPIRLKNGAIFGTLCCLRSAPNPSLGACDLRMVKVFAELVADSIDQDIEANARRLDTESRVHAVLAGDSMSMVYQPIYRIAENHVAGFETLARFSDEPHRTPDVWFNEATEVGLGIQLELKAIKLALVSIEQLPANVYVSLNLSPETILNGGLARVFEGRPLERFILEVTEHAAIEGYSDIASILGPLRDRGLRIAVDDAGAGYSSFRHILKLGPDYIKLDISITRNIDTDISRRSLAAGLASFARATNKVMVAEGVETASELSVLQELGIDKAQGYFLGKPMAIASATKLVH
jgi:EAL domain-containing protein (putative c-di-GMP-specific phosphodiesterase class I)